jgi:hypothetical protein
LTEVGLVNCQQMPQGMRYISKSGNVMKFSLEMPVNDDGLYQLQCPQSADQAR